MTRELSQAEIFGVHDRYGYDEQTWHEVEHMLRLALPSGTRLKRAPLRDDFGGVDGRVIANYRCPIQYRVRKDRPIQAPDIDVTFRATEPAMIEAGTYAPLMLFVWLQKGYAVAGKLVDVYAMAQAIEPRLRHRPILGNRVVGRFHAVEIHELVKANALLMQGGRDQWAPARLGGAQATERILNRDWGAA